MSYDLQGSGDGAMAAISAMIIAGTAFLLMFLLFTAMALL